MTGVARRLPPGLGRRRELGAERASERRRSSPAPRRRGRWACGACGTMSIGTNDLLQYLFAADRLNGLVSDLGDVCQPKVLDLIGRVVAAGHEEGTWVGVCGEAASDPTVAVALVGLGVDELSMTGVAIPEVKDGLRRLSYDDCRAAVRAAIEQAADGAEARRIIEGQLKPAAPVAGG